MTHFDQDAAEEVLEQVTSVVSKAAWYILTLLLLRLPLFLLLLLLLFLLFEFPD